MPKLLRLATRNSFDSSVFGWIPFSALDVISRGNRGIQFLEMTINWPKVKCVQRAIDIVMRNQKCHRLYLIATKFYQSLRCQIAKTVEIKVPKYTPMLNNNDNSFSQVIVLIKTYQMIPISLISICVLCQKWKTLGMLFFSNFRGSKKQCEFYYFCMRLWLYGIMTKKTTITRYTGPPWSTTRNLYTKKWVFGQIHDSKIGLFI